jgi:hypothetical protein
MKIGKLKLETVAPDEARLLSSTGLSVAEMYRMLAGTVSTSVLARAANACLEQPMHVAELSREIAGDPKAQAAIAEIYGRKEPKRVRKA